MTGPFARRGTENPPTIVGGEIDEAVPVRGAGRISGAVLQVNGILYVSVPDNAWAVDARDGSVLWHYYWKTKGGTHIGNRGMGMYQRLALLRDAGRLSGFARCENRQRALA